MKAVREGIAKVSLCVVLLLAVAICSRAQTPTQLNVGDVVVATQGGYQVWDPTLPTTQTPATMAAIAENATAGCAFDSTFRMRAGIPGNEVVKFAIPISPSATITQTLLAADGISGPPQSIVFDGDNNFFVGIPGSADIVGHKGTIVKYDASGTLKHTFSNLPVDTVTSISLDINQAGTIVYYTSGGSNIGTLTLADSSTGKISVTNTAPITGFSATGGVVTIYAINNFPAGTNPVTISGSIEGFEISGTVTMSSLSPNQFTISIPGFPDTGGTITVSGTATVAPPTLYGIRVITPSMNNGELTGFLAAIGTDVAQISTGGSVVKIYLDGADDAVSPKWRAVAFAPDGGEFWATNLDNGHLIEFNLVAGGEIGNTFDTGANNDGGFSGLCVVGDFSPAQPAPIPLSATLTSAANSNTFTFTTLGTPVSLGNGVTGTSSSTNELPESMIFNPNQNGSVKVNVWFIEVGALVGVSDTGVPCAVVDTPTPTTPPAAAAVPRCAFVKDEFTPDPGSPAVFSAVDITYHSSKLATNPVAISDGRNFETTFVVGGDFNVGTCHCSTTHSVHNLPVVPPAVSGIGIPCGYQTPVKTTPYDPPGGNIPLKFATAASPADCRAANYLNSSSLKPIVKFLKLDHNILTGMVVLQTPLTGGTFGYRYDPQLMSWVLNVSTRGLGNGCYIATTMDTTTPNPLIASFSFSQITDPATVFFEIGKGQCAGR